MIKYKRIGRFANVAIQYAFARIVHEITGLALTVERTNDQFENIEYLPNVVQDLKGIELYNFKYMEDLRNPDDFLQRVVDQCQISGVILSGFFQNIKYFKNYREVMRHWFDIPSINVGIPHPDDFVAHIRHEDYKESGSILTFNYYDQAIETYKKKSARLYFCGKDLSKETIEYFEKKHNAIYINRSGIEDFKFIQSFNNIIGANSSNSWLASFLSKADRIILPRPIRGYWSSEQSQNLLDPDIHIIIEDNNA